MIVTVTAATAGPAGAHIFNIWTQTLIKVFHRDSEAAERLSIPTRIKIFQRIVAPSLKKDKRSRSAASSHL